MDDLFRLSMSKVDEMREMAQLVLRYLAVEAPDGFARVNDLTSYIEANMTHRIPTSKMASWRDNVITKLKDLMIIHEGWGTSTTYRLAPEAKEFLQSMLAVIEEAERARKKKR